MAVRVAILISGRGSNMQALLQAKVPNAEMALVLSNVASAPGLDIAKSHNVPTEILSHTGFANRAEYDKALDAALRRHKIDFICLAGFMRILSADFVAAWPDQIINIHPSLLPDFKGLDTHKRAIEAGKQQAGCTVHFVRPAMDDGPIILQAACPILPGDDESALAGRVLALEHKAYPLALKLYAEGKLQVQGNRVIIKANLPEGFTNPG